jgi:hypothetical protein
MCSSGHEGATARPTEKQTKKLTSEIGSYIVLRPFNGTLSSAETIL